nr:hypothetical protein [Streptomyces sp. WELS2]
MPGTVLLLAASPVGRGRLVDAAGVLPVLAAVAPAVLSGADTANVVELADPLEPQAVLTRLRAAAAAPGPLTVYVTGQLHLDRRQHRPHLALARTTAATLRYTALPWHWIREELRLRSAGDTALVVDLHADAEAWKHLTERGLDCGPYTAVYGRVAPPARRGPAEPVYMKTVATLLRSGRRPPLDTLHEQALSRIPEETRGNLLMLALPGSAYLYQGEELGLPEVADLPTEVLQDPIWEQTGHTRKGRDGCRVPLPWTTTGPSYGFGPGAGWLPQPTSFAGYAVQAQAGVEGSTLELYRAALRLRRKLLDGEALTWNPAAPDGVLDFTRTEAWRSVTNLGAEPVPLPPGEVLLSSTPLPGERVLPPDTTVWLA